LMRCDFKARGNVAIEFSPVLTVYDKLDHQEL
jgi:hypothetical protein